MQMRRDPRAIIVAHRMDPSRRELYVEGSKDKAFIEWLVVDEKHQHSRIVTIDFVNVEDVDKGGNRERLVKFMRDVEKDKVAIRGLIDADSDYLRDSLPAYPPNIWITDWRNIESYVMSEDCLQRTLKLGCANDTIHAPTLFKAIVKVARRVAATRYVSESEDLQLPISQGRWTRYVKCTKEGNIDLNFEGFITALMNAAQISLSQRPDIMHQVLESESRLSGLDDLHVVHGHDFMAILTRQIQALGVQIDDAGRMMWTAFQRKRLADFPTLSEVVSYLSVA